jgi:RNA polymerase sigma-70 factor (ECF subfamily)
MDPTEIAHLLERIAQRDEQAFRTLYKAHSRKLYAYALRQLSNDAEAEEIVSDTLYEVWARPERFRGDAQFGTWLIGIVRNKALMRLRSRYSAPPSQDISELDEVLASEQAGPFERLAEQQRQHHVRHCLERLNAEQRECMHLVFFQGLSLAEIAQLQACPEGTVKTRAFHARQKLRNCLSLMLRAEAADAAGAP